MGESGGRRVYQACVSRYLLTLVGADTPPTVAARLLALRPESIGMSDRPDEAEIHIAREGLERIYRDAAGVLRAGELWISVGQGALH
jgi:hypothetical protein